MQGAKPVLKEVCDLWHTQSTPARSAPSMRGPASPAVRSSTKPLGTRCCCLDTTPTGHPADGSRLQRRGRWCLRVLAAAEPLQM
eukprot:364869-Chlamydomonas_euryale.AAC.14